MSKRIHEYRAGDPEHFVEWLRQQFLLLRLERVEALLEQANRDAQIDLKAVPPAGVVTDTLTIPWEIKAADEASGFIQGYASTFHNIDLVKDIIHPGAFTQSIKEATSFARAHHSAALYPLLWMHQREEPIGGIVAAREDARGLLIDARLNLLTEKGRQAFHGLQHGYLAFSIGYRPVLFTFKGAIRHLTQIKLAETSVVTFPANPEARATQVGGAGSSSGESSGAGGPGGAR